MARHAMHSGGHTNPHFSGEHLDKAIYKRSKFCGTRHPLVGWRRAVEEAI